MPVDIASRTQPTPQEGEVGSVGSAAELVAISTRYEAAPPTPDQVNVGDVVAPVAELVGVNKVGARSVPDVVNEETGFP